MEPLRDHRRTTSSDRFLTILSPPSSLSPLYDGDLDENDVVFWSGNFSDHPPPSSAVDRRPLRRTDSPGILAALQESNVLRRPVVCRKPMIVLKREVREEREYAQSAPAMKFLHSAPVSVPVGPARVYLGDLDDDDEVEEREEEMLPPHEIVARGSLMMDKTTFSVLEGVGRTLKGRDLRQVRNAVWRQTGFLD